MAREDLHFRLRIPEELKKRVETAAAENHRSMTAEIIARLEESFQSEQGVVVDAEEIARLVQKVMDETFAGKVGPVLTIRDARDRPDPITREPAAKTHKFSKD